MKTFPKLSRRLPCAGLTLIELMVVLSIVAVLSTVAMRSVVGRLEQQNYDANLNQLEEIERAVLGDGDSAGFLGDIGRLPQAVGINPLTQLQELWLQGGFPDYAINTPSGDAEVRLGTGWRGPYLNLGLTRDDISDGFGNAFGLYEANGDSVDNSGETIAIIQSLGLSGTIAGTGYEEDVETVFHAEGSAVTAGVVDTADDRWRQDVTVNVQRHSSSIVTGDGVNLIVRAYGSNGAGAIHTVSEEKVVLTGDVASQSFTLSNLSHGAKVLRAYQDTTDPSDKETPIVTDPPPVPPDTTPRERKSPATLVVIDRFTSTITLTLY